MNLKIFFSNNITRLINFVYYIAGNSKAGLLGVKIGNGAKVSPKAIVKDAYYIGNAKIGANVIIGKGSYINSGIIMSAIIGNYCSIGYNVLIGLTEHDSSFFTMSPSRANDLGLPIYRTEKVIAPPIIEDEVWIGANVVVLKGVTIGSGAIVGAGAVVTKNIPPMEIWGGIPAKFIKKRIIKEQQ